VVAPDPERGGALLGARASGSGALFAWGRGGQAAMPRAMARPRGRDGNARNRGRPKRSGNKIIAAARGIFYFISRFLDQFNYEIGFD